MKYYNKLDGKDYTFKKGYQLNYRYEIISYKRFACKQCNFR